MDIELEDWIRWGLGGIGVLSMAYARYIHGQMDTLREQVVDVKTKLASVSTSTTTLARLENDLSSLTKVVYRIAGHLGVPTGD